MKSWRSLVTRFLFVIGCMAIIGFLVVFLPPAHWHLPSTEKELPEALIIRLETLGTESLKNLDVPVAAVVLYGDSIIGEGYNTVRKDNSAGGHAEINAISDAMNRLGLARFTVLNRDSLLLISTFEPCAMCTGAILEYRLKHVRFLKSKPVLYLLQERLRDIKYRWRFEKYGPESLQDSLFFSYPGYRPNE